MLCPPPRENVLVWLGVCGHRCLQRYRQGNRPPAVRGRSHRLHHRAPGEDSETNRCRGEISDRSYIRPLLGGATQPVVVNQSLANDGAIVL